LGGHVDVPLRVVELVKGRRCCHVPYALYVKRVECALAATDWGGNRGAGVRCKEGWLIKVSTG
jgi:hypothetical protein